MLKLIYEKQTLAPLLIVVAALLVAGGVYISKQNTGSSTQNQPSSMAGMMMVENNSIAVAGQGATNMLTASMIALTEPGYVVVHEDNNGQPGKVIGTSKLVGPGMAHEVMVMLSRNAVQGEKLYAMLHKDNGDKTYSDTDSPVTGKNGEPIMMIVGVGEGASETPGAMSM